MGRPARPQRRLVAARLGAGTAMTGAVNDYLGAIAARGLSAGTVAYRAQVLSHLVVWLAERNVTHPAEVTKPVLDRYQRHLFHYRKADGAPLSFRTQGGYLVAVKGLFSWLARTNRVLFNPASELELPRAERRLPRAVFSIVEVEAVLAVCGLDDPLGLRDRVIMEVLYSTGIRRAELARLAVVDLDVDRGVLTVRQGKGRKDRLVPIGERALAWMERYQVEVRPGLVVPPDPGVVFLTVEGNPITTNHLTGLVARHVARAGIGKTGSCHTFRHTMATLMLEGGADIRHIQEILGHAHLDTTERYTHVSNGRLKAVHDTCHPGATNTRHRSPCPDPPDTAQPATATEDPVGLLAALDDEAAEENQDQDREPGGIGDG